MEEERGEVKTDAEEVFSTEKPVAKKKKREQSNGNGESGFSDILAVIQVLAKKQDDSFSKISAIELTTNSTAKQIEKLTSTVEQLVVDVECHKEILKTTQLEVENLKKENKILRAGVADCKRYSWSWAPKLHRMKEETNEDTRKLSIDVMGKVAPGLCEYLEEGVDIVHRVGPRKHDSPQTPHRSIIILFALRRIRDAVWKCAKGCRFLRDNKLRLSEALSPEDRLAREKLATGKESERGGEEGFIPGPLCFD
jgi:hypothetical protein